MARARYTANRNIRLTLTPKEANALTDAVSMMPDDHQLGDILKEAFDEVMEILECEGIATYDYSEKDPWVES